jgi:hypothetical protein
MYKDLTLSRSELLAIVGTFGLTDKQYENWQRDSRGVVPKWNLDGPAGALEPVGKGHAREYNLLDAVYAGLLKVLADHLPNLVAAASIAGDLTPHVATEVMNYPDWPSPVHSIQRTGGGNFKLTLNQAVVGSDGLVLHFDPNPFAKQIKEAIDGILANRAE